MFGYTIYLRVVVVVLTNLRRPGGCAEKARTRVTFSRIIETDVISAGWSHTKCVSVCQEKYLGIFGIRHKHLLSSYSSATQETD